MKRVLWLALFAFLASLFAAPGVLGVERGPWFLIGRRPASDPGLPTRLLQKADFVYVGAFKVPHITDMDAAVRGLAYYPEGNSGSGSLFIVGAFGSYRGPVAEISLATPEIASSLGSLNSATTLQAMNMPSEGAAYALDQDAPVQTNGVLVYAGKLYTTVGCNYGCGTQTASHFRTGLDFSVTGDVEGPYLTNFGNIRFLNGYLGLIPAEWRTALHGPVLTGNCCQSIISGTSPGPSVFSIDPEALGSTPATATPLVYYETGGEPAVTGDHWINGPVAADMQYYHRPGVNLLWNATVTISGVAFPGNTATVLFVGRLGTGDECYGTGTSNMALHGTPVGDGSNYCYDPGEPSKGEHSYPYSYYVWAYDAAGLAQVAAGSVSPWSVQPYAVWDMDDTMIRGFAGNGLEKPTILGAAWDPVGRRLFLKQEKGDGDWPLIHVYTVTP